MSATVEPRIAEESCGCRTDRATGSPVHSCSAHAPWVEMHLLREVEKAARGYFYRLEDGEESMKSASAIRLVKALAAVEKWRNP